MAVNPSPFGPKPQWELADGLPAVGYKLFSYVSGSVGTKRDTFTDSVGNVANPNPIVLNSLGEPPNEYWFTAGESYKVVLAPANDTDPPTSPVWTIDDLRGINDNTVSADQWVASGFTPTFINGTQFTVPGDQTSVLQVGRRVRCLVTAGTVYGTITVSAYGALTTVTVALDSGALDSGLSQVSYGLLSSVNPSIPTLPATGGTLSMSTARILGRTTASTGAVEEISIGSGLSLAAGVLTAPAPASDWTLGTAVATTSGTTKDFTGLPANVAEIIVMLYNVSTGGSSNYLVQIGTSGGMANSGYSSQAWQGGSSDTLATSSAGFLASAGGGAARNFNGALRLTRFSGNKWVASGVVCRDDGAGFACAGIKDLGAELTQLRFTTVSADTFDAGEVNILYRVAP